jgi:hypothetical protein
MASINITCPAPPPTVPALFTVVGTLGYSKKELARMKIANVSNSVWCVASYFEASDGDQTSLGQSIPLGQAQTDWCCQFNLSAEPPPDNGTGTVLIAATLRDGKGNILAGPTSISVTYDSTSNDGCQCAGGHAPAGRPFDASHGI